MPVIIREDVRGSVEAALETGTHEGDVPIGAQCYREAEAITEIGIACVQLLLLGPASMLLLEDVRCILDIGTHEGNMPIGAQRYGGADIVTGSAISGLQLLLLGELLVLGSGQQSLLAQHPGQARRARGHAARLERADRYRRRRATSPANSLARFRTPKTGTWGSPVH